MTDLVNQDQSANQSVMTMMTSSVQVVPIMGSIFRPSPTHYPLSEDQKTKHGARSKNTQSKSSKRTSQSTLAVATAGQQQVREQHKRPHVPTAHFGKFGSDQQVTHTIATNNRDFTDDLTVQDPPSKRTRRNVEPPQVLHRRTKLFCFLLDCCSIRKTRCAANDSRQQLSYR